ncbi:MAG: [LysW]-aminoadipate/[LysW]-glutamate kinase [Thaumarchaeota archaeon]|nr:[LysW]-aminoadipate/[LysW]-glutamate kinase [Nitrososphaerota archaeon]
MSIVVKVGGSILGEGVNPSIVSDIQNTARNSKLIIIHGGGDEVTEIAEKMGKEQKFIVSPEGIRSRYTDKETAAIYTMVMVGRLNKEIVAALEKIGAHAVGLSGIDGSLIRAERKKKLIVVEGGRKRIIDGGYTGKIQSTNAELLRSLISMNYIPVVSPVALSEEFEFLNVDGDRAAAYVAEGLKADKVIFLTDVNGVLMDGKVVEKMTVSEARAMLPKIGHGMEKKVLASIEAVEMGVKESIIASGIVENPISSASSHKNCTVIVPG